MCKGLQHKGRLRRVVRASRTYGRSRGEWGNVCPTIGMRSIILMQDICHIKIGLEVWVSIIKQLNLQNKLSVTCTKLTFPLIMERIWCYPKTYLLNIWCIGTKLFTSFLGAIAQLGEHLLCKQEVVGSIPTSSTENLKKCP